MHPAEDLHDHRDSDRAEVRATLTDLLGSLDRDQLQALLLGLARSGPELAGRIEARALALQSLPPPVATSPSRPALPPPDLTRLRGQVHASLHPGGYRRGYDYEAASQIAGQLSILADQAQPYLETGDGHSAFSILEVVAEALTDRLDDILDEGDEISSVCLELGALLAEAVLTADLSPKEREEWADKIGDWQRRAGEYGVEEGFQIAAYAIEQGWTYPPLRRVLEGEITEQGAWDGDAPACADDLTDVRLRILERQGRWDEYLRLAEAENRTERYLKALVRVGRTEDAVACALKSLRNREDALEFARTLEARGKAEDALRIAEHSLATFDAGSYSTGELAAWTRDLAARLGRRDLALAAALTAVRERPNLANYTAVAPLAGEEWPALREEALARLRRRREHYPSDEIDIFLHEGLIEDAMAAVDASPRHELVERVVDAALPTHAEWVFRACTHQFDRIADAGKSPYYREAAQWLSKAKMALKTAGREAEWRPYIEDVITRHGRKYSLRPMLERLR